MNYNKTFKESILIMSHTLISCWEKSLLRLKEGNKKYLNVVGSVEYAVSSLATPLVVVMGYTYCGAIRATIRGGAKGYIKAIAQKINLAINDEKDECAACRLNLNASANELRRLLAKEEYDVKVIGALYHTDTGQVGFFDADV